MKVERVKIADTEPTSNGWMYPMPVIEKMYQKIKSSQVHERFGEYGFPESHVVEIENVAFTYENPELDGNELFVDIIILNSESGNELKDDFKKVKFAPVGLGKLNENKVMQDDYEFLSVCAYNPDKK